MNLTTQRPVDPARVLPRVEHFEKGFQPIEEVAAALETTPRNTAGGAFDRVMVHHGSTYRDCSTVVIMPTRDKFIHYEVWQRWSGLIMPMNQKRHMMVRVGDEVGIAYNEAIRDILAHPELSKWRYVMTVESDNLIPPDAQIRMIETLERYRFDGVSGIYFTKGEVNMPMAYGNAARFRATGELEFAPIDIREALSAGDVVEVNGIANGCSLYRLDLFREMPYPWFMTVSDVLPNGGAVGFTQDLYFCKNAKAAGKRFGVDMRVRVGHMDLATGEVY